jgi:hypothetical protein
MAVSRTRLGFLQDGNIGFGVFSEREEAFEGGCPYQPRLPDWTELSQPGVSVVPEGGDAVQALWSLSVSSYVGLEIFGEPIVIIDRSLEIGQVFPIRRRNRRSDPRSNPFEEYVSISIQVDARDNELSRNRNTGKQSLPIRGPGETADLPPLWQREIPLSAILQIEYADLFTKLVPTRKSDVRTVWRNAPLQVVSLSCLSTNDFLTGAETLYPRWSQDCHTSKRGAFA